MSYSVTAQVGSRHVLEPANGTYWLTEMTEHQTRTWRFIVGSNGTSRYVLRPERGVMVARTYKTVPVETHYGDRIVRPRARFTFNHDGLPESGNVVVLGNRAGYLSWFSGAPEYDGHNIDGGVIHKVYVSPPHRRKGVATAMFEFARELNPDMDIRHSNALTDDGAAFAAATPTANDLPGLTSPDAVPIGA